jgi:transcriptional regulator with XRE-family HTH domain
MNTGKNIIKLRNILGLSQMDLCKLIKISQPNLSQYENNRARPGIDVGYKLLDLAKKHRIKMHLEDFISKKNPKKE